MSEHSVQTTNGPINVLSAGSDQLFRDLTPAQIAMLPSYQGELVMQRTAPALIPPMPRSRNINRQNEQRGRRRGTRLPSSPTGCKAAAPIRRNG